MYMYMRILCYILLQLTYICYTLKTIISGTSQVNVTKRLPVRNGFAFVMHSCSIVYFYGHLPVRGCIVQARDISVVTC